MSYDLREVASGDGRIRLLFGVLGGAGTRNRVIFLSFLVLKKLTSEELQLQEANKWKIKYNNTT